MIGIINYKAGNAKSVAYALRHLDLAHCLVETKADIKKAKVLLLPGVGSARATLDSLGEQKLLEPLRERVLTTNIFFLGICVGLQILFEHSEEEDTPCLHWLDGKVKRFDSQAHDIKVPQIGWNQVKFMKSKFLEKISVQASDEFNKSNEAFNHCLSVIESSPYFYFVNSYHAVPSAQEMVVGVTDYGTEFASMIWHRNICATQFHLEKSGPSGLALLRFLLQVGLTGFKEK